MRWTLFSLLLMAVACAGNPTSPTGASEGATWTVNGASITATSNGRGALRAGSSISLTAANCSSGAIISILLRAPNQTVPGTYPISDDVSVSWTPDARSSGSASEAWQAPGQSRVVNNAFVRGGSGSVTISSISGDWVSGGFNVEVIADPSNRDTGNKTLQGTFELSFRERTIC